MSEIVNKMQKEIIDRANNFEKQTMGTKDEYNIYREHIQYVYKYILLLFKGKSDDLKILIQSKYDKIMNAKSIQEILI